jgi:hypothetical protein
VFAAGRILNMKMARSQAIGGMVFGAGAALTEEAVVALRLREPEGCAASPTAKPTQRCGTCSNASW